MRDLFPGLSAVPNLHPLFVHFPVTLWIVALGFCAFGLARSRSEIFRMGRWLLYLGTLGAAIAAATGLWAEEELGHDSPGHEFVHVHRNYMLVAFGLAAATSIAAFLLRNRESRNAQALLTFGLTLTAVTMTFGADRGAALVYGHGIGVAASLSEETEGHEHDDGHGDMHPASSAERQAAAQDAAVAGGAAAPAAPEANAPPASAQSPTRAPVPPAQPQGTSSARQPAPAAPAPSNERTPAAPAPAMPPTPDHGGHSHAH